MEKVELLQRVKADNNDQLRTIGAMPVLVALSGGADSVALLRILLDMGCQCHAAHCNFNLRGEESKRDEQFVRDLCLRLHVPLTVKSFDVPVYQLHHGGSVEMACRDLRYAWFEEERLAQGCALIAVAHHADDQIETFYLNLMRGTGLRGLTGMKRLNGNVWRPLLGVNRNDLLDYLEGIGQNFVTDSTNAQNDFRRNRLRNIILPVMQQEFPHASERTLDTMTNLSDDLGLITAVVMQLLPDERHIERDLLVNHPQASTLLYHRIRHLGFNRDQCRQAIAALTDNHSGRQFHAHGHVMHINRLSIDIEQVHEQEDIEIPIDLHAPVLSPVNILVSSNNAPFSPSMCDGKRKVAFNTSLLQCQHIVLRHWRQGDRIKPFGLKGSKLVSDVFADLKLDQQAKRDIWIMEADGEILWILGYRAAAHYPVDNESQDYLFLSLDTH